MVILRIKWVCMYEPFKAMISPTVQKNGKAIPKRRVTENERRLKKCFSQNLLSHDNSWLKTYTHKKGDSEAINSCFGKIHIKYTQKGSTTISQRPFGCREVMEIPMFVL